MQKILGQTHGVTISGNDTSHFEIEAPGDSWDVWFHGYAEMYCVRKNDGESEPIKERFESIPAALRWINTHVARTMDTSGYHWERARVNPDGSIYLGYAAIRTMHEATIRYLADIRAERLHGVDSYAELMANLGSIFTFKFITVPFITVGYGTYDAARDAWL